MTRTLAHHRKRKLQKEWSLFLDGLINDVVVPKDVHNFYLKTNVVLTTRDGKKGYFVTKSKPWPRNKWQLLKKNVPMVTKRHYKDFQGFTKTYIV